jgi:hypothetical protein
MWKPHKLQQESHMACFPHKTQEPTPGYAPTKQAMQQREHPAADLAKTPAGVTHKHACTDVCCQAHSACIQHFLVMPCSCSNRHPGSCACTALLRAMACSMTLIELSAAETTHSQEDTAQHQGCYETSHGMLQSACMQFRPLSTACSTATALIASGEALVTACTALVVSCVCRNNNHNPTTACTHAYLVHCKPLKP